MSGDSIYMDYFSVLGPIDPQVPNKDGKYVPALGYLDKINEMLEKAKRNELTQAEFLILKDFDLAELRYYEQARELSIDLLEKWLVKYKFKNWEEHRTKNKGKKVKEEEKRERAKDIAKKLSDNNLWKTHNRPININHLRDLRLEIIDYSENELLSRKINDYYQLLMSYLKFIKNEGIFIHTKKFF